MFYFGDEYLKQPHPKQAWIIKDLFPAGGMLNIFGKPKSSKSWLAVGMCVAVSSNQPHWMGIPVLTHGPVAYLQIDTPRSLWIERMEEVKGNGYDISRIAFADLESAPMPFNILANGPELKEQLDRLNPVLVVLDTMRELHGGDENDSGVMKNVVSAIYAACRPAAMCLVSHAKKEGANHNDDLMSDNRGSSYVAGKMDGVIRVTTRKGNDNVGTMTYGSRRKGEAAIQMVRSRENGIWVPNPEEMQILTDCQEIVRQYPGQSVREYGRLLAEVWKCTPDAARGRFRERQEIMGVEGK